MVFSRVGFCLQLTCQSITSHCSSCVTLQRSRTIRACLWNCQRWASNAVNSRLWWGIHRPSSAAANRAVDRRVCVKTHKLQSHSRNSRVRRCPSFSNSRATSAIVRLPPSSASSRLVQCFKTTTSSWSLRIFLRLV
ncbi:uncharacterized protein M421DRAFT_166230 [Didymella exigua CBS 183.55]|uniref:Uncharacterized protein n=1 Tax=Didymella exigua CBS 183.55 TaxID=1150837 RepID=A0A6A5RNZ0_9PLEO|nr:uncharacterized protein M421DRAFT_166230 [Didymella exigua CBS 183.55]KAF1928006.1 hypothetical protein M421DRAFT_166230 [Didymella exigua CBS 183.55]